MARKNNNLTTVATSNTRGSNSENALEEDESSLPPSTIFYIRDILEGIFHEIIRLLPHLSTSEAEVVIEMLHVVESLPDEEKFNYIEKTYYAITEILTEVDRNPIDSFVFNSDIVSELCFIFNKSCSLLNTNDCQHTGGESCTLDNISDGCQKFTTRQQTKRLGKDKRLGIFLNNSLKAKA